MFLAPIHFLFAFALLVSRSAQHSPTKTQLCAAACSAALDDITFGTTVSTDDYYTGYCQDTLRFSSLFFCVRLYCSTPAEIHDGAEYLSESCHTEVHIDTPSYDSVISGFPQEAIAAIPVVEYTLEPSEEIFNVTVVPSEEFYHLAYRTWDVYQRTDKAHFDHSWIIYGFWGLVLLIGIVNRLFALLVRWNSGIHEDPEAINRLQSSKKSPFSGVWRWVRRHIILPATFGYRHQEPWGWCTIPTRIQSLTVFAFVGLNIVLCSVKFTSFPNNLFWHEENRQIWTYVTDRTGFLSVANLPLLWIFAGRNDVFLWLTGWNFGTFNIFHRYLARVATVEAIVHSIGYTGLVLMDGGRAELAEDFKEEYWYCGVIAIGCNRLIANQQATICMSFLLLFSIYPIRQKAYELFLTLHISLALILLVTMFYHIKIWEGKFEPFLWPVVAIWVFDRFVRLMRLLVMNYKALFLRHTKVVAFYNPDHDIIRLSFTPAFHRKPKPGTHYYLYFPFLLRGVGSHPFTMSSWSESGQVSRPISIINNSVSKDPEKGGFSSNAAEVSSHSSVSQESKAGSTEIRFVIRPYKGLTAHLRDSIKKTGTGSREMTALIEGPYGETAPVFQYNNVIFIAGGSGISAILPYVQEFLSPRSPGSTATKGIHIVWTARQHVFIRDVIDTELVTASTDPKIKLDFFVTGPSPPPTKEDELTLNSAPAAGVRYERPDIKTLLHQRVGECLGTVAIFVCGPAGLADDARRAAVEIVGGGLQGLGYFEEQFGW